MKDQFVPYEKALKLKELGFNESCLGRYTKGWVGDSDLQLYIGDCFNFNDKDYRTNCLAPLWQQAFDWFRKEHGYDLSIQPMTFVGHTCYYDIYIQHSKYCWDTPPKVTGKTYEEAREACLLKLISLCQEKK